MCRCCGNTGHWAKDCPCQFDIRYLGAEELRVIAEEKFQLEGQTPSDSLKDDGHVTFADAEELPPSREVPSELVIRLLDEDLHPMPTSPHSALPSTQVPSRHLPREGVIVRGTPSCSLLSLYLFFVLSFLYLVCPLFLFSPWPSPWLDC